LLSKQHIIVLEIFELLYLSVQKNGFLKKFDGCTLYSQINIKTSAKKSQNFLFSALNFVAKKRL